MTVDELVSAIAHHPIEDMHPDDVEFWRGVIYTVRTLTDHD